MKKRIIGLVLSAMLVLMMGLTAVAAPSASTDGVVNKVVSATDKDGKSVEVVIQSIPEEHKAAAEEIKNVSKVKEVLGDAFVEGMEVVDVREVSVVGDGEVTFPVTITFDVPGVLESTKVAVLHYVNDAWKVEPSKAGKGTITATFESLSPVAFVVDKNTAASSVTSPQTGESSVAALAGVVVLVTAAGAFVFRRKSVVR